MYESYFGFSSKPFQLVPDPEFFFGSKGHKRALAYLEYGLHQAEGFIVITGEVGAGKTTLVRNLLKRVPKHSVVAAQIVSTQLDANELLAVVASAFGLETGTTDKSQLLTMLETYFKQLHSSGMRALLIVDEAQNLSAHAVEELRMLSNFQVEARSLVQSFLVGQPEFREMMQRQEMRQLKQRIIASYHLGPLDLGETQAYVEHRLRHVGWTGMPSIDTEAYSAAHGQTSGVPRRINTLFDRVLLATYLSDSKRITLSTVESVAKELAEELGLTRSDTFSLHTKDQDDTSARSADTGESSNPHLTSAVAGLNFDSLALEVSKLGIQIAALTRAIERKSGL